MDSLEIFQIWHIYHNDPTPMCLIDAWDEGTINDNPEAWEEAKYRAKEDARANDAEMVVYKTYVAVNDILDSPRS